MQELNGQRKGTKKYFYEGYFYHADPRYANIKNAYVCSYRYRQWQCPVTLEIDGNQRITVKEEHGHFPTDLKEYLRFEEFKLKLKEQAQNSTAGPTDILRLLKIEYSDVSHLIRDVSARMHIMRERQKTQPRVPKSFDELADVLEKYQPANEIYKKQVIVAGETSAIIFASSAMLQRLNTCEEIYVDGTFKCVPKGVGAKQLLILHTRKMDVGMASVFVLCANQTASMYQAIWTTLIELVPGLKTNLKFMMMDFERALIKSVKVVMPWVVIRGCWFHFTRALSFHWHDLGLKLVTSPSVQDILSLAWVLPLLRADDFAEAIEFYKAKALEVEPQYRNGVSKFIEYLENQWLRIAEIVSLWKSPTRTNNICESYHRWLPQRLGTHPNLYVFIEKLAVAIKEVGVDWENLERDGNASGVRRYKQSNIDTYINYQQTALSNGKISVSEFLMKLKTKNVKNLIQFNLFSPHRIKSWSSDEMLTPQELIELLGCPQKTNESSGIILKKSSKMKADVNELKTIKKQPSTNTSLPIIRKKVQRQPLKEKKLPLKSVSPKRKTVKRKTPSDWSSAVHEPRYKLSSSLKAALETKTKYRKKKQRVESKESSEARYKFSPAYRKYLKKEEKSQVSADTPRTWKI